jgi:CRISPR-associated protein Cas1
VGFIHTGKPLSFVYDIADLFKFDTVVPVAFKIAAKAPPQPERDVRLGCRDIFRSSKLLARIIPMIEEVLSAGEIAPPEAPPESIPPAIPNPEGIGDVGHRVQD